MAAAGGTVATSGSPTLATATPRDIVPRTDEFGVLDVRRDFLAVGDGKNDDTVPIQRAINEGSRLVRPITLPPGAYKISRPLDVPSNTMLLGSAPAMGFGCRIEPIGCPAFAIGGATSSFHCSIENLMVWPKGAAPEFIISIDNSYSVTFRNVRIHEAQAGVKRATVLLLGDPAIGGHGACNDIIWDNLIVRNDVEQPTIAVLATRGCGTHRFIEPCLENYATLFEWQGGQIDMFAPYTERAGRCAIDCNTDPLDTSAYLNTFGGIVNSADSGLACAIRDSTGTFNSFGTCWGGSSVQSIYFYGLPKQVISFHGLSPNLSASGHARVAGVPGWRNAAHFPTHILKATVPTPFLVPARSPLSVRVGVRGVTVGDYWVRVTPLGEPHGINISGYVSGNDSVTVALRNVTDEQVSLVGGLALECGLI
jgi:hypothetical protein